MNVLTLNIGTTSGWAVYNETNAKKIVGGKFVYKNNPKETIIKGNRTPSFDNYKIFRNLLDNTLYNHDSLNNIYFINTNSCDKKVNKCYLKALDDFCNDNNITYQKLKLDDILKKTLDTDIYNKEKIIKKVKQNKHLVEDDIDAIPIIMLDYITNKVS